MKNIRLFIILACLFKVFVVNAQSPFWAQYDWKSNQEGSDSGVAITNTSDGGMLMSIGSKCNYYQNDCFKLLKLNSEGEVLWNYEAEEEGVTLNPGIGIKPIQYQGFYYVPVSRWSVPGDSRAYLFRIDSNGNEVRQLFIWEGSDYIQNCQLSNEGIITWHQAKVNNQYHAIARFSDSSGQVFKEIIHENGFSWEGFGGIDVLPDSTYIYTNQYAHNGGGQATRNYLPNHSIPLNNRHLPE